MRGESEGEWVKVRVRVRGESEGEWGKSEGEGER